MTCLRPREHGLHNADGGATVQAINSFGDDTRIQEGLGSWDGADGGVCGTENSSVLGKGPSDQVNC